MRRGYHHGRAAPRHEPDAFAARRVRAPSSPSSPSRDVWNLPTPRTPRPLGEATMPKADETPRDVVTPLPRVPRARVLVVEDNPLNRLLVHDILELRGHE